MSGDTGGWSARRALKPKFYQPNQTMVTAGILPFRENSHGRAGNRTRDLMISSQRLRPLDHEAGRISVKCDTGNFYEALSLIFERGYNMATVSGSLQGDIRKFYRWYRRQKSAFMAPSTEMSRYLRKHKHYLNALRCYEIRTLPILLCMDGRTSRQALFQ